MRRVLVVVALLAFSVVVAAVSGAEDWNCADADSLTCDLIWTEVNGDIDIASNAANLQGDAYASHFVAVPSVTVAADQCVAAALPFSGGFDYPSLIARYTNSSTAFYELNFAESEQIVQWIQFANVADFAGSVITSSALTWVSTDRMGVCIEGANNSTVVRIWLNPTGAPTTVADWNGDSTPDVTLTEDPYSGPPNSGGLTGIGGYANTTLETYFDDFGVWDFAAGGVTCTGRLTLLGLGGC
jgi:hypothetical protein